MHTPSQRHQNSALALESGYRRCLQLTTQGTAGKGNKDSRLYHEIEDTPLDCDVPVNFCRSKRYIGTNMP